MTETLRAVLSAEVVGTPLAEPLERAGAALFDAYTDATSPIAPGTQIARGLARAVASNMECGRYLAHRPELMTQLSRARAATLAERASELLDPAAVERFAAGGDLEASLDELRLLRSDETVLTACLDLSDEVPFELASEHLSIVAEGCMSRALALASQQLSVDDRDGPLSVVGMGKLAGRELTYRSDLDLIFLYPDEIEDSQAAAKLAQRMIAYLSTPTGAGVAYEIDARLRPSGRQGALVTSYSAFSSYQTKRAALWEHLALLRARAISGRVDEGQALLERVQRQVVTPARSLWPELSAMRDRVTRERGGASKGQVPFKAGAGGLMDVDFLAAGGLLERGTRLEQGVLPSVPEMLRASSRSNGAPQPLDHYSILRRLEARARWVIGRAVERVSASSDVFPVISELFRAGLSPESLLSEIETARSGVRGAFERVVSAQQIGALSA
jgi:glutamate-ammonia-ligase adenylyltransferase